MRALLINFYKMANIESIWYPQEVETKIEKALDFIDAYFKKVKTLADPDPAEDLGNILNLAEIVYSLTDEGKDEIKKDLQDLAIFHEQMRATKEKTGEYKKYPTNAGGGLSDHLEAGA